MKVTSPGIVALGICFALSAAAAQPTVNFGITAVGADNLAGVYTDPYHGLINGTTEIAAFCDDFTDDVSPPQFWTALVTNLSELPNSPSSVFFSDSNIDGKSYSETTEYIAAAMLAVQSLESPDADTRSELSFALWGIFDPPVLANTCPLGCMTQTQLDNAVAFRGNALLAASAYASGAAYEAANSVNVVIYTPTLDNTTPSVASDRPQEFITVQVPEPSSWAALGVDAFGAGLLGLVFLRRRQALR